MARQGVARLSSKADANGRLTADREDPGGLSAILAAAMHPAVHGMHLEVRRRAVRNLVVNRRRSSIRAQRPLPVPLPVGPHHGESPVCYREAMLRASVIGLVVVALATLAAAADVATVSRGAEVRLEDHLVPGKLVLVDFYADWCGPCRVLTPRLERLAAEHPEELALRKVDIVEWSSPVARQHRIRAVPHLRLYDGDGIMLADGDTGRVLALLEQRLGSPAKGSAAVGGGRSKLIPVAALLAVVAVAAFVLLRRGVPTPAVSSPIAIVAPSGSERPAAGAVWFAMIQGSLEGPFSPEQLADLVQRRVIGRQARVRRRGEAAWRELAEVLEP